ncbi:ADP-ribose pyrophosphatase [Saccharobesus litoralis]|uniref:ADP-ribose pyrophosphatase n=1 Tax=Saccharobesus litoralis TaxID=2172099 RepID=A0A2S0VLD2_9ALTE|nr:NUDIX hydrolase [Saccharobesus litoralis]AWB65024.1 ADP-ribose pyrophosphatase [Saccharobesus litoralis]
MSQNSPWFDWAKQLRAIAQAGHAYSENPYDLERFDQIAEIAHKMFAELTETPVAKISELFVAESGYPTPKVDVRAGVIQENKILLVKERADGLWTLPGGFADVCETPSEAVVRETLEESGYIVNKAKLIAVKDRDSHNYLPKYPFHIYKMFFLCDLIGGEPTVNLEASDIGFFALNNIPELSQGRTSLDDIKRVFDFTAGKIDQVYCD